MLNLILDSRLHVKFYFSFMVKYAELFSRLEATYAEHNLDSMSHAVLYPRLDAIG